MDGCVFCQIIAGTSPADMVQGTVNSIAFRPLGPQVPGHVLFVPLVHVSDATENAHVTASTMYDASRYAAQLGEPCNLITSVGAAATQSVFHLHIHVLPRGPEDGVRPSWPWTKGVH